MSSFNRSGLTRPLIHVARRATVIAIACGGATAQALAASPAAPVYRESFVGQHSYASPMYPQQQPSYGGMPYAAAPAQSAVYSAPMSVQSRPFVTQVHAIQPPMAPPAEMPGEARVGRAAVSSQPWTPPTYAPSQSWVPPVYQGAPPQYLRTSMQGQPYETPADPAPPMAPSHPYSQPQPQVPATMPAPWTPQPSYGPAPSYGSGCCEYSGTCAPQCDSYAPSACWDDCCEESPTCYLVGYGGASYFDSQESSVGGEYGLTMFLPIYGSLGAMANGTVNHYNAASQYAVTAGLYQAPGLHSFGWSALFNQFTDTGLDSPYLVQGQYSLVFGLAEDLVIGGRYTDPIHGDDVPADLIVPTALGTQSIQTVEAVEANLTYGPSVMNFVQAAVGYIDDLDSMTYRVGLAEPIGSRVSLNFNTSYVDEGQIWSGFVGLSVDLSRGGISGDSIASRSGVSGKGDVVRGGASMGGLEEVIIGSLGDASGPSPGDGNPYPPAFMTPRPFDLPGSNAIVVESEQPIDSPPAHHTEDYHH